MTKNIPNIITLFNMLSGILSIYCVMIGYYELAAWMIFAAAFFDFIDGFAARLLKAKSEIGGQLDSLADVVSFGVAPGFIMFHMLNISHGQPGNTAENISLLPFLAFIIPAFGALRLAKFNVDPGDPSVFKGLPIPAMGILVASLPLIRTYLYQERGLFYMIITNNYFLLTVAVFGSLLMVSNFPMFSLKFNGLGLKENMIKYIFLGISLLLIIFLQVIAIPFIILLYLFISLVIYLVDIQS